jgi:transcriptional regulator with XRE-family HTH domain
MAKKIPEHPFVVEVRVKLESCRGSWPQVVEKSGVSHSWISQFARRIITNPTIQNLQLINRACDEVMAGALTGRGR